MNNTIKNHYNKLNRKQVLNFFQKIKLEVKQRLAAITTEELNQQSIFEWYGSSVLNSFIDNLRRVLIHVGALN